MDSINDESNFIATHECPSVGMKKPAVGFVNGELFRG